MRKMTRKNRGNIPNRVGKGQIRLCEEIRTFRYLKIYDVFIHSQILGKNVHTPKRQHVIILLKEIDSSLTWRNSVFKNWSATFCYKLKTFQFGNQINIFRNYLPKLKLGQKSKVPLNLSTLTCLLKYTICVKPHVLEIFTKHNLFPLCQRLADTLRQSSQVSGYYFSFKTTKSLPSQHG